MREFYAESESHEKAYQRMYAVKKETEGIGADPADAAERGEGDIE